MPSCGCVWLMSDPPKLKACAMHEGGGIKHLLVDGGLMRHEPEITFSANTFPCGWDERDALV